MDATKKLDIASLYSARGLVVVVSGGGSGIGLAYTSALVQTGAKKVYILGRRLNVLEEAAQSVDPDGSVVVPIRCDVTDQESIVNVAKQVEREVGYLDVLINNSGIIGPSHTAAYKASTVEELQKVLLNDFEGWAPTFDINVTAVARMSAQFLPLLDAGNKRRGWSTGCLQAGEGRTRDLSVKHEDVAEQDQRTSQIITTSSIAGFNRNISAGMAYGASKAGATALAKTLATLLAPYGIRSNVIAPGIYPSDMTTNLPVTSAWEAIPAGRRGSFEEIAGSLLHLVGSGGSYLNGLILVTDGGRLSVQRGTY